MRPSAARDRVERFELGGRLDVEAADACRQRGLHLGRGLADAREHDLRRIAAGGDHPRQLAAGNDVEAASEAREDVQHSEVGIRLDGVANEMRNARERGVECAEPAFERSARVDVAGGAEALGDRRQRHAFGVELAADAWRMRSRPGRLAPAAATSARRFLRRRRGRLRAPCCRRRGCRRQLQRALDAARRRAARSPSAAATAMSDVANPGGEIT